MKIRFSKEMELISVPKENKETHIFIGFTNKTFKSGVGIKIFKTFPYLINGFSNNVITGKEEKGKSVLRTIRNIRWVPGKFFINSLIITQEVVDK